MKYALALVAVAGVASSALAASTMTIQTSVNGGPFAANQTANVGDTVRVRILASTDLSSAVGLSGIAYRLTASGWTTDALAPWSTPSGSADSTPGVNGPGVRDSNGNGRLAPFAASAATSLPTSAVAAGVLTIGGSTAGSAISTGQNAPTLSSNGQGNYFSQANPVAVFAYTFTVGAHNAGDVIGLAIAPASGATGQIKWYNNLGGTTSTNEQVPTVVGGSVTIVPSAGSLALLGLGGLVAGRRRR